MIRLGIILATIASAEALAVAAASAQSIVCCSQSIPVGGGWVGSSRLDNCQDYFDAAPSAILERMCQQRQSLPCINTDRCDELPPGETDTQQPASGGVAWPPNPDRDGLEQGFDEPPPAVPPPMPRRLVYLMMLTPGSGKPFTSFTVFLDHAACLVPLTAKNKPLDPAAAQHVVRGRITREGGRIRIEAEANALTGERKLGPFTGEAMGEDATAVAAATRIVLKQMNLACSR